MPGCVKLCGLVGLTLLAASPAARAIQIYGTDPTVQSNYDRFTQGSFPGAPTPNPSFIGNGYDLSGVGWDDAYPTQGVTMISSQYFVFANHYPLATDGSGATTVSFENTAGVLKTYTVNPSGYQNLTYTDGGNGVQTADLRVGMLTAPIPAADLVNAEPILYLGNTAVTTIGGTTTMTGFAAYNNTQLLVYGRGYSTSYSPRMGTNTLQGFTEYNFTADSDPPTNIGLYFDQQPLTGQTQLEGGDSGSPTFGVNNGVFGLLGTHSGTDTDPDNGLPLGLDAFVGYTSYITQLGAILATSGQHLDLVPEPASGTQALLGWALGGAGAWLIRRSRRRATQGAGVVESTLGSEKPFSPE